MGVWQNEFVRAVIFPVIFTVCAVLLEAITMLARGRSQGKQKFRVWVEENGMIWSILRQTVNQIRSMPPDMTIVDIDEMGVLDLAEFASLGIELEISAITADIVSLIGPNPKGLMIGYLIAIHFCLLIGILFLTILNQLSGPYEQQEKRTRSAIAIVLGLIAMTTSFWAL